MLLDATMNTALGFFENAYALETHARLVRLRSNQVELDRTVFYPATGVTPADRGELVFEDGSTVAINETIWDRVGQGSLLHIANTSCENHLAGEKVIARIAWPTRYRRMKVHTALHVLSIALPYPAVGGHVDDGWGYVTFQAGDLHIPRKRLTRMMQHLIDRALPVDTIWMPPRLRDPRIGARSFDWPGSNGLIRAVRIGNLDIQPCDGLHVANTSEIGSVEVASIRPRSREQQDVHVFVKDDAGPDEAT